MCSYGDHEMTLKIIGAGFGRTGTHSLKLALEQLNLGPCHHLYDIRENPALLPPWQDLIHGQVPNWDMVFDGYMAQVDWPGARYWLKLHQHFPKAKVILTTRDPLIWYESLRSTVIPSITIGRSSGDTEHARAVSQMIYDTIYLDLFQGRMEDRDFALQVYADHVAQVAATVPKHQLLIYDVREGWEPLCDFLGLAVPDAAFPKTNSTEEFLNKRPYLRP